MPNVNGFEVLDFYKNKDLFRSIPISIITGVDDKESIDKAFKYPIVDILLKPFNERDVKRINNSYKIKIGIYFFNKIPILWINLNSKKIKKISSSKSLPKVNFQKLKNKENINNLLSERDFSAMRKARLLSWCIESNKELKNKLQTTFKENLQLNNGNEYNKFFEQYNNDIIKYRNALAHVKNSPIDSTQIIGKVDGEDIIFDQNLCNKLRKKLLNYEKVLNNLYEYIENSM